MFSASIEYSKFRSQTMEKTKPYACFSTNDEIGEVLPNIKDKKNEKNVFIFINLYFRSNTDNYNN